MTAWVAGNVVAAIAGLLLVLKELSRLRWRYGRLLLGMVLVVGGLLGATGHVFRWLLAD